MSDLKEVKKKIKSKKPKFRRQEAHRKKLPDNWRRPKGHHSKVRIRRKWKPKRPNVGYRTPKELRGCDRSGKEIIHINNLEDAENLRKDAVYIVNGKLGLRKKAILAEKVMGKEHFFKNFNPEEVLNKVKEMKEKKKEKEKKEKEKKKLKKKLSKKPKKKLSKKPKKKSSKKPKKKSSKKPKKKSSKKPKKKSSKKPKKKSSKKPKKKSKKQKKKIKKEKLEKYYDMNARPLIEKINKGELNKKELKKLLEHEKKNKNRKTVVKAIQNRG